MHEGSSQDKAQWQEKSTTLVLLQGSYLIADYLRDNEPEGDPPYCVRNRMTAALAACRDNLDLEIFGEQGTFERPSLESLCASLSLDDKYALLVELRLADPFFPFQFEMTKKRDQQRVEMMRQLARRELDLGRDAAVSVDEAMRVVAKAYSKSGFKGLLARLDAKDWLVIVGSGALIAGAAVVAAPLIAAAMPAAAGLSGAAAVSAGLAYIGGGSLAAGGLGMAGGMWVLGIGGAALGGGVAGVTVAALRGGDGAGLVEAEVLKLCISFELAAGGRILRSTAEFESALDQIHDAVSEVMKVEMQRNEEGSERLKGLESLNETLTFAGEFMTKRLKKHSS